MYGDVGEFQINPAGNRVVYTAAQNSVALIELFSVRIGGGVKTKLSAMLASGGDVKSGFRISPNGTSVVYIADQDLNGVNELYSVPISGGAAVKLNPNFVDGQEVFGFQISPDGSTVVYRADQDSDDVAELYSVPIGGGASVKLNGAMVLSGDVSSFRISADSTRVVYQADQTIDDSIELYTTLIAGGGSTKLNPAFSDRDQDVINYELSPDSTRVVYRADVVNDSLEELFSVPIAGGAVVKLNGALRTGGQVSSFSISPDSNLVVYRATQEFITALYSVDISGGVEIELTPLVSGRAVENFEISPNGNMVAFRWGVNVYLVPISGGTLPVNKTPDQLVFPSGFKHLFQFSPNSKSIVFIGTEVNSSRVFQLYAVDVAGSSLPVRLSNELRPAEDVFGFTISDDSLRVLYTADQRTNAFIDLFLVDIKSRISERVNSDLPNSSARIQRFEFSPDNQHIVYQGDQDVFAESELFSVDYGPVTSSDPNAFPCFPIVVESGGIVEICL